ncbi:MAG: gamma-glutamyltransferase [Desulfobacterales bacterium]|nr:gamma-glutamyltransferase [Desulfobacterales bacterium]
MPLAHRLKSFAFFILVLLLVPVPGFAGANLSKRDAVSRHGMVATAHPLASQVGVDILKSGGNAVDAAVAVGFALGVLEPNASGLGGGGFMMVRLAETGEVAFLDFRETAPAKAAPDMFKLNDKGRPALDQRGFSPAAVGGRSVAVPGEVAGLLTALEKYGTMDRTTLMTPAISYAENGIRVSQVMADLIMKKMDLLDLFESSAAIYFTDGFPKEAGEVIRNADLAHTLRRIAEKGRDGFYKGEVAEKIVAAVRQDNGVMTLEDLAAYRVRFRKPVSGSYRGYDIVSAPPASSGGTHVIELLNIMEHFDMEKLGFNTPESWHAWAEAMKLVYADRARYMADTDFIQVPLEGLTSKAYGKAQFRRINMAGAATDPGTGDPWGYESGSTTHYSIVDAQGNMVAVTKTINHFFGSGITAPGTGVLLNDEMDDFTKKPGEANSIAPGKKPLSSMSPTLILKDGVPFATLGTPGGKRIISTLALLVSNLIDHSMDIQAAINAPRISQYQGGELKLESRISPEVRKALESRGHVLSVKKEYDLYFGGAQGVTLDPVTGERHGGADPRRDGRAVGY